MTICLKKYKILIHRFLFSVAMRDIPSEIKQLNFFIHTTLFIGLDMVQFGRKKLSFGQQRQGEIER
jgi:hypothetical protein